LCARGTKRLELRRRKKNPRSSNLAEKAAIFGASARLAPAYHARIAGEETVASELIALRQHWFALCDGLTGPATDDPRKVGSFRESGCAQLLQRAMPARMASGFPESVPAW